MHALRKTVTLLPKFIHYSNQVILQLLFLSELRYDNINTVSSNSSCILRSVIMVWVLVSVLLWYDITSLGDGFMTFLDNMVVEIYQNTFWFLKMRALIVSKHRGTNYPLTKCHISEQHMPQWKLVKFYIVVFLCNVINYYLKIVRIVGTIG